MEQKGTCQNHYQIRLSFAQIQRRCFPVNHALSFSHHPKSFGVIFEGNPTEWQPNLFQRSKYSSISTAVSQLQLLQRAACILPRWWVLAQLHAGHTHSSLLLCLGCIQSHDCKHLTIVTWKKINFYPLPMANLLQSQGDGSWQPMVMPPSRNDSERTGTQPSRISTWILWVQTLRCWLSLFV